MSRHLFFLILLVFSVGRQAFAQSNDQFSARLMLAGANPTAVSNNAHATHEAGESNHAGAAAGRSLWYTWTAPASGTVNLSTYAAVPGAPALRALAVYTGDTLAALTEVASSNDRTQSSYLAGSYALTLVQAGASLNVPVTAGTVYQIAIDAVSPPTPVDDDGTVVLAINAVPTILSAASVTGTTGTDFSYTVVASAGATAFGASNLPGGLVINTATGLISGAPSAAGTYVFGVSATGPGGTGTATVTLRVADPTSSGTSNLAAPTFTNAASARGYVGVAFSFSFTFSGTVSSFTADNLPPGFQVSTSGRFISGTPTTAGVYSIPITATGPGGTTSATVTVAIYDARPAPILTNALAATATVGSTFSYSITTNLDSASTGLAPTAWTATNLPPGLTMPASSRFFSGTPTTAGTYAVPITAANPAGTRRAVVTITVQPSGGTTSANAPAPPVLGSYAAASGTVGTSFSYTLTASNAPGSFTAASLPPGLSLNATSGAITGTPTAAGTYAVPVTAANSYGTSTGTFTLTIYADAAAQAARDGLALPVITSPAVAGGYVGTAFSYNITANYQGSAYSSNPPWAYTATGLPPGLSVTTGSNVLGGYITGTPTTVGTYTATLSATYQPYTSAYFSHPAATGTATVTFVIRPAPLAPLPVITSAAAMAGAVGADFFRVIQATGNPTGYTASGLPPGLGIDSDGYVTGTPTAPGTYPATISVTGANGTGSATVTFFIAPLSPPVFPSSEYATRSITLGYSYNYTFTATNRPTGYAASGLPPGMSFNTATGLLSGTPTAAGVYPAAISATNAAGTTTVVETIRVTAPGDPTTITGPAVVRGTVGADFYQALSANSLSGLPPGLTYNGAAIMGKPTQLGSYPVTVTSGTGPDPLTAVMTINIANPAAPDFLGGGTLTATSGQYFYYTVEVNAVGTTFTFTGLPPGVTANPAYPGYFSGTPTMAGTYRVGVTATNVSGSSSAVLTVLVGPNANAPNFGSGTPLEKVLTVGVSSSMTLYTSNPATGYSATGLPPGLTLDASSGLISGVPTTVGTFQATITAANASGSGSAVITYAVRQPVVLPPVFDSLPMSAKCLVGTSYTDYNTTASNNPTGYSASGLPNGLSINTANGTITGTPTTAGRYRVNLTATNSGGTGTAVWTLNVRPTSTLPLTFGPNPLEMVATTGQSFSASFSATLFDDSQFASDTISYSITGSLPPGLTANGNVIQGTPTTAGSFPLTVNATASGGSTASESILLLVVPAAVPVITSAAGASGTAYTTFGYSVAVNGSSASYGCGTLPDGLAFNAANGLISGTPTTAGTYAVAVSATNANGTGTATVTLRIDPPLYGGLPIITSAAAVSSQDFPTEGTPGPFLSPVVSYQFTALNQPGTFVVDGVPVGLVFNPSKGLLSGTPVAAGVYRLPVSITNGTGTVSTVLTVVASSPRAATRPALAYGGYVGGSFTSGASPLYLPAFLSSYAAGGGYSSTLDPVLYSAAGLPPGLGISSSTGLITGTFSSAGVYSATITAANRGGSGSAVVTFSITSAAPAAAAAPSFATTRAEAAGFLGVPMSFALAAPGATTFTVTGLPPGLAVDPATGLISGTPIVTGTTAVAISASNSAGTTQATLTVVIEGTPPAPAITSACVASATVGSTFGYGLAALNYSGLPAPTRFASGPLPAGLSLNTATGVIGGTPTGPAGTFAVPVTVSVGSSTAVNATLTLVVKAAPPTSLLTSAAGALGLTGNPFNYALRSAVFVPAPDAILPAGLAYDATGGALTGYPTANGTNAVPLASPAGYTAVTTLRILMPDLSLPRLRSQPVGGAYMRGAKLTLDTGAVGVPAPACQWYHNGVAIPGATDASLLFGGVGPADTGDYTLTAANAAGRITSMTATLLVLTTYGQWQTDNFSAQEINAGLAADNVSFSGDGVPNLLKYAFGLNPRAGSSDPLPVIVERATVAGSLQIKYERDAGRPDIDYLVEASTDLSTWMVIAQSVAGNPTAGRAGSSGVVETVDAGTSRLHVVVTTTPPTGGTQFLRLRVVRP